MQVIKKNKSNNDIISFENNAILIETIVIDNKPQLLLVYKNNDQKDPIINTNVSINNVIYKAIGSDNSLYINGVIKFISSISEDYLGNKDNLIKYIKEFIYKYVDCSEEYLIILSYYVLFTYFYRNYEVLPYLRVIGDYGSGKSQILKAVGNLCYNPMIMNGSASLATVFRVIDLAKGTLIYDEADVKGSDTTNEFIKILNNGYQKGMPVFRSDGDDFNPRAFDVFGPKIIGGRMEFSDKATESRCLSEIMKRSSRSDLNDIDENFYIEAEKIRNMCFSYKLNNLETKFNYSYNLDGLEPRIKQILKPILSIISDENDAKLIINKMKNFQEGIVLDRGYSLDGIMFKIIQDMIKLGNSYNKISIKDITDEINENPEYYIKNVSPRMLSNILRQNGIKLKRVSEGMVLEIPENQKTLEDISKKYGY